MNARERDIDYLEKNGWERINGRTCRYQKILYSPGITNRFFLKRTTFGWEALQNDRWFRSTRGHGFVERLAEECQAYHEKETQDKAIQDVFGPATSIFKDLMNTIGECKRRIEDLEDRLDERR